MEHKSSFQQSRKDIISKHVIDPLESIISEYTSDAVKWFFNLPKKAEYPEDYPTYNTLCKYLVQLIRYNDNDIIRCLFNNFGKGPAFQWLLSFQTFALKINNLEACTIMSQGNIHVEKLLLIDNGAVDLFVKNAIDIFKNTGDIDYEEYKRSFLTDIDYLYVYSLIHDKESISLYIEKYFGKRGLCAFTAYKGNLQEAIKQMNTMNEDLGDTDEANDRVLLVNLIVVTLVRFNK